MRTVLVIMTGIGFFLGVVFGLLLQLPIDNTLPADVLPRHDVILFNTSSFRSRSLSETEDNHAQYQEQLSHISTSETTVNEESSLQIPGNGNTYFRSEKQNLQKFLPENGILRESKDFKTTRGQVHILMEALRRSSKRNDENILQKQALSETQLTNNKRNKNHEETNVSTFNDRSTVNSQNINPLHKLNVSNNSKTSIVVKVRLNLQKSHNFSEKKVEEIKHRDDKSFIDASYLASIVSGIFWTPDLEKSCPKPFRVEEADTWRRKVDGLDVVKITEGCGRMQNRLITFKDASKACARYRLNTDQIQGEIFSYYLARIFNMTNIPPTVLARIETLSSKWRTVHLQLSLAQWAETKLIVLTQHINGLQPAHIPAEFKEETNRLEPTLSNLGSKSHTQLCELVQWSDLIVFDYLTANLDRVINNMFNRQWNDQMMSSPAHNLEQQADGSLVFLDNESGLFHGYRLLDKYSNFHRTLLQALCVFRPSTAEIIKRLHQSSSIGTELHSLFISSEVLHEHLAVIPEKNIKILQQRIDDVYRQILYCESLFNR